MTRTNPSRLFPFSVLGAAALACSSGDDSPDDAERGLSAEQIAELDGWIDTALERYSIPGAAVAIVRGPQVIYERGFGIRGLADPTPVTTDTRFMVGSVTKGMTSLLAATLVDAGKLSWDAPVVETLRNFRLSSPDSTRQMRVHHLFDHSSGVSRQDTQLFIENLTPTRMIASLRDIPIVAPPGETYIYHNQMVATGGFVASLADGASYDDSLARSYAESMQRRVLDPIGMPRTTFDAQQALQDANHAWPHAFDGNDGAVTSVPTEQDHTFDVILPAGGAWSSISDLAAYASTQLSGIAPSGERVVSLANLEQTHTKAVEAPQEGEGEGYAMGWHNQESFLGMRALWHDGDTMGTTSEVLLLPDAHLAVVVVLNRAVGQSFYHAVERFAAETALGREHLSDAEDLAANAEVLSSARGAAGSAFPVSREEAQPYLGSYGRGVRVEFDDRGFVLTTELGATPLVSLGEPAAFAGGGVITAGRLSAAFDPSSLPVQLQLDLFFNPAQPLQLVRQGD
jgi:CubicO group peptidase (beta-lactamase class C family)